MNEINHVNMTVKDLKDILEILPNDMEVIIPVISSYHCNEIYGFRHVRTAGILSCLNEDNALCLNSAENGADIVTQVNNYDGNTITCEKVLF